MSTVERMRQYMVAATFDDALPSWQRPKPPMVRLLRLFCASLLAAAASVVVARGADRATTYRATVVDDVASGSGSVVTLTANHKAIGHFTIADEYVVLVPEARVAVYGEDRPDSAVVARGFDGRIRWRASIGGIGSPRNIYAGGNTVVAESQEGTWGIQSYHIESWPEIYASREYEAFAIDTGRQSWASDEEATGIPFWTNGKIVLTLWLDLGHKAVDEVANGRGAIPIWLQVRSADNLKLLWQRRLPGWPPIFSKDISVCYSKTNHRLRFTFKSVAGNRVDRESVGADRNRGLSLYNVELPLPATVSGDASSGQLFHSSDQD